jgi:hypothetical protein
MRGPNSRRPARRELVAAIIGAEAGAAIGLVVIGWAPFAPLGLAAVGAGLGTGVVGLRNLLIRCWLRSLLRAAR